MCDIFFIFVVGLWWDLGGVVGFRRNAEYKMNALLGRFYLNTFATLRVKAC